MKILRDPVVRMIVVNWALGALVGTIAAAGILVLDIAHLRTLLEHSDIEWAGLLLLFVGFAATFGGVAAATAAMFHPVRDSR